MGELEDYYMVRATVVYDDDPLKIGRIKCDIPGVIDSSITPKDAIPWVRPFKMHGYQTFSRPEPNELVWVLISRTNYNEFWWTYFHETIDITQEFLNAHYDEKPEVFHARNTGNGPVMFTFDTTQGYVMKVGNNSVNFGINGDMTCSFKSCKLAVSGNKVFCGAGDSFDEGTYPKAVNGDKCIALRNTLKGYFIDLKNQAQKDTHTELLAPLFDKLATAVTENISCDSMHMN